jgi:hypothetical protein
MDAALRASLAAGPLAGAAGIAVFSVVHWLVIFPTWDTLTAGLPFALLAGLPLGWGFHELRASGKLPSGLAEGPAYAVLLLLTLLPVDAVSIALPQPPLERLKVGAQLDLPALLAALLAAVPAGLLAGWAAARTRRVALAMGLAGLAFALTLGHNIPFFAADARAAKMWGVMVLVALVAGLVLAAARARLAKRLPLQRLAG